MEFALIEDFTAVRGQNVLFVVNSTASVVSDGRWTTWNSAPKTVLERPSLIFYARVTYYYVVKAPMLRSLFCLSVCLSVCLWHASAGRKGRTLYRLFLYHLVCQGSGLVKKKQLENIRNRFAIFEKYLAFYQSRRGGSTLGPGGHRPPPQMLARPPKYFGSNSKNTYS